MKDTRVPAATHIWSKEGPWLPEWGHKPNVYNGKLSFGDSCRFGFNTCISVAEEVVLGDRVVIGSNSHLEGRRIEIGSDFFGFSYPNKRLLVGQGRLHDEGAILRVGDRCTFHDNQIDLSCPVTIGDDVGLSPEVVIYTHGYWMNLLEGFPCKHQGVTIGDQTIVGFRSTILPGAAIGPRSVIGAQSLVSGILYGGAVYGGVPARELYGLNEPPLAEKKVILTLVVEDYVRSARYRGYYSDPASVKPWVDWPYVIMVGTKLNVETLTIEGYEDEYSDDLREFLFKRGLRFYTKRPFRKLPMVNIKGSYPS